MGTSNQGSDQRDLGSLRCKIMELPEHKDKIGQTIRKGDLVVYPVNNSLYIGSIIRITPKMVRIVQIKQKTRWDPPEHTKYPVDCVKIESAVVSMYLLTLT